MIESSVLNFGFSWPNENHTPDEEYHENLAPSVVSKGSNDPFANSHWSPGSTNSPVPNYNSLSPHPPLFHPAEEEQQREQTNLTTEEIVNQVNIRLS